METLVISNPKEFEKKKNKFKLSGTEHLHVIADFDKTLTRAFVDGKRVGSAIAQIRNNNCLSKEYTKKAFELFDKYHPIEFDINIPLEKKIPLMEEWWSKHLTLLVKSGMKKEIIDSIVEKRGVHSRKGLDEFISFLNLNKIPILILSAGLGDVIDGFLEKKEMLTENIHVISNYFDFDENGFAKGYKGKIVHVFNKDESQIKDTPYFEKVSQRKNVLLLGDSLGDLKMTGNIGFEQIIKVGFLNEKIENMRLCPRLGNFLPLNLFDHED